MSIETGLRAKRVFVVGEKDLAISLGGSAHVLASPILINFIELACVAATDHFLASGETTVGLETHFFHLAPTPPGWAVSIEVELVKVAGGRLTYTATATDPAGEIGKAEHVRCIVNADAFEARKNKRIGKAGSAIPL